MERSTFLKFFAVYFLIFLTINSNAQITGFSRIRWARERIAMGLILKYSHTVLNDSVPQNINILIVNLRKRAIALSYNPKQNLPVSRQVQGTDAIAAVNGGFFNIREGGSVSYIKTGGRIADTDTSAKWTRNANINGALLISSGKNAYLGKAMPNSWYDDHKEYEDILLAGPLMVSDRKKLQLPSTPLVINRHPRTAIGIRNRQKVILVTLDGRTDGAFGMTLNELSHLMLLLRCHEALNLDGGGSTTMWIKDKPFNGIVNMPCDNKKFDHEGERAVSDIIVVR